MKKIRKNAKRQIENILKSAKKIKVHTNSNNYNGEFIDLTDKDIRLAIEDIKEGFATLYHIESNIHHVKYADKCYWEISV